MVWWYKSLCHSRPSGGSGAACEDGREQETDNVGAANIFVDYTFYDFYSTDDETFIDDMWCFANFNVMASSRVVIETCLRALE